MSWYYHKDDKQEGPITKEELDSLFETNVIAEDTLVWQEGMDDWAAYSAISESSEKEELVTCSVSGIKVPQNEAVQIDGKWVSAKHKQDALDALEQGGTIVGDIKYAGFWIRFAARFLDGIITSIISYAVFFAVMIPMGLTGGLEDPNFEPSGGQMVILALATIFLYLFPIAYETWMVGKYQATLGKMAVGIKVVRSSTESITKMRSFGRTCANWISAMTLFIGYIIAAFDKEKRSLHDHICDTRVIYK